MGYSGVDIFFLLSGMGLTYSIKNHTLIEFWVRRLKRIGVPFAVAAVMYFVLDSWSIGELIRCIFGVEFWFGNFYKFLWFMPAIITFYIAFPAYYKLFTQCKRKVLFTIAVATISVCIGILLNGKIRNEFFGFINRIPIFVIGIYFGFR